MAWAQPKNRQLLLSDARPEAITDEGDDAADNRENEDERDTVHERHPFLSCSKFYCEARFSRTAPAITPTIFGNQTASIAGSTSPRANALPIVMSA